jgi:F420-dependent oxidoreductase-like protein
MGNSVDYRARMTLRVFTEPQQGASYDQLLAVARAAEECGFGAFFRSDHYLRMGSATGLPSYTDAWVTLAGLARDTSTIRLGTLVTPVTFRPVGSFPVIVAEVDHMSGGRVEVGLGAGWYADEHGAYGLPFPSTGDRYNLLEDQLAVLHGLWSSEPASTFTYDGRTTSVQLQADALRPAQRPHPPIVLGGMGGPRGARLVATYADEFNVAFAPAEVMKERHDNVRRVCEARGRDPESLLWSTALVVCCGQSDGEIARRAAAIGREVDELRRNGLAGSPGEVLDKLGAYAAAGAERFYLQVLDLTDLEHLHLISDQVQPHAPGR